MSTPRLHADALELSTLEGWRLFGKSTVDGESAGTLQHNGKSYSEGQKVILKAFALLIAVPVYKKPKVAVDGEDRNQHIAGDTKSRHATKEADYQADAAEKFGANGEEGERCGDVHALRESTHRGGKSKATEPAENLLSAMRKKNDTED
jgi:hypothetical protein